jgi:hypothetical protein
VGGAFGEMQTVSNVKGIEGGFTHGGAGRAPSGEVGELTKPLLDKRDGALPGKRPGAPEQLVEQVGPPEGVRTQATVRL